MRTSLLLFVPLFFFSVITIPALTHNPWNISTSSAFGYLPDSSTGFNDKIDTAFISAVLAYQKFFHLNSTGILDHTTVGQMVIPRCGVPDFFPHHRNTTTLHGRDLYSFFDGKPTWPKHKRNLKYYFTSYSTKIRPQTLRKIFARSFSRWERVTLLSFQKVHHPSKADIFLRFYSGNHGDNSPFDGRFGVLAHAFAPTIGELHFDADEIWAVSMSMLRNTPNSIDLESVTTHELGHILGLGHSTFRSAIMYPSISSQRRKINLRQDDIHGIQELYGVKK
ncbi:Matrix metalloproteinase-9 [Zostera marina]|uniref:Matrix metalloproteinase-9 n=1 Tax=Zostera marina TaxID=29655 RepID=A0A0K9PK10_ZOSMR|nr:Matrix metalloproteinase-9 [Zostera marina]